LLQELPLQERVMVLLAGTTGLRRSELIALIWEDIDFESLEIRVNKSCVRGELGETKTPGSAKPLPLHAVIAAALQEWKLSTPYSRLGDFLFPSVRNNGTPSLAGHGAEKDCQTRRGAGGDTREDRGLAHLPPFHGNKSKVYGSGCENSTGTAQACKCENDSGSLYQAVSSQKREANHKLVELLLPSSSAGENAQHLSAPSVKIAHEVSD
jgi:Phage integrase family